VLGDNGILQFVQKQKQKTHVTTSKQKYISTSGTSLGMTSIFII
jgi:hypothetical protein